MPTTNDRIAELEALVKKYQGSYYNGEAEIDDAAFDALWDELAALAPESSVLQKVGADSGNFPKAKHVMPMGSQEKAANPTEFRKWAEKHAYDEYLVEHKLDGASLELQYSGGALVRAVTRGDGVVGDDITANARKMKGVLASLAGSFSGGIRGEVIMTHDVHATYFSDKANCRNAANGLMKRKDGQGAEHLLFMVYDAWFSGDGSAPFLDETEKIAWLISCGFTVTPLHIWKSVDEVIALREKITAERAALEYDIDGLVVKPREIDNEDALRARPDKQIAFKFSLEEAVSVLRGVEWSESGATYTPIALFDVVNLAGTQVKRASLVNPNTIRDLGVKIGSRVVVTKRGEIIPKIERVVEDDSEATSEIEFPTACSACGTALVDEGTHLYCPNSDCPKRVHHRLEKWIAALDVRDFGETLIRNVFDSGRVRSITDLYSLTTEELTPFFRKDENTKDKTTRGAEIVIQSLYSKTHVPLAAFVAGFDIDGIGETLIERLTVAGFNTLEKLLAADAQSIAEVNGFAEITAKALVEGLAVHKDEMLNLTQSKKIVIAEGAGDDAPLAGKSFCFTGELTTMKRADAERKAKDAGGSIKSSVTKDLSYLVTNDTSSGSAKNAKAASLGIPIIDEQAFLALLT
jgi:DNA ligase (NAD+)